MKKVVDCCMEIQDRLKNSLQNIAECNVKSVFESMKEVVLENTIRMQKKFENGALKQKDFEYLEEIISFNIEMLEGFNSAISKIEEEAKSIFVLLTEITQQCR